MGRRVGLAVATAEVARRDPALAAVIERAGPMHLPKARQPDRFLSLAEAIVYQQLAGAAASAIWGRVVATFPDGMAPEAVAAAPDEVLRAAGLSANKARSIKDLAAKVLDGSVPLRGISRASDDEIVRRLTVVRGIGPWTAEMFLLFDLHRLDVWPVLDYGVRTGWSIAHGLAEIPTPKALGPEGEVFRPYRSVAAWYCWRAVELTRKAPAVPGLTQ